MIPPSVALVTGANRGLGRDVAERLAKKGYRVLVAARDREASERAAAAIRAEGGRADAMQLDVTRAPEREALAARLQSEGARLDVLVNNSGVYRGEAEQVMAVNFFGPLALTDLLTPLLAANARVVMVSSGLGRLDGFPGRLARRFDPPPDRAGLAALVREFLDDARAGRTGDWPAAYNVSKAALNVLARLIAAELGERARVNAVSPGWVRTRMGGAGAPRSIEEGSAGIVWAATLPRGGPTGGFFEDGRPVAW